MQCDSVGSDWPTCSRNPAFAWLNLKHLFTKGSEDRVNSQYDSHQVANHYERDYRNSILRCRSKRHLCEQLLNFRYNEKGPLSFVRQGRERPFPAPTRCAMLRESTRR